MLAACVQAGQTVAPPAATSATPSATTPTLTVSAGGATRTFSSAELLARSDTAVRVVRQDPSYRRSMEYRAVPLRAVLAGLPADAADTIEMRATDGFVAQIPIRLLASSSATPWIAVEDPAHPWPPLPGKTASAGPFYLIWDDAESAGISPEQWPYALSAMTAVASPVQRWPALAVDPQTAANGPARRGQAVFITNCLACHRLAGSGEATIGPDLLRPMAATAYLSEAGLRALIRDPGAVRKWPQQQMPAFDARVISDADIDAVIAYLRSMATRLR